MPARTVVIEKLTKWNGETHADITPGEYTQLTGRAGRRGLDVEGHGVVLWQPGMNPREVAGLASTRTYPLRSSFRPSYNMAVNLVAPVRPRDLPRAARAVVRPVPGRQGRGRAGPAAAQGRGGARGLRRGRALPPRRLHGVRRPAAPDLRRREGRQQGPPRRPPRGGDRVAAPAQARRRDRGADRQVRRVRRRDRPRLGRRQPAALRRHRRPAGPPAGADRLPGAGGGGGQAQGPEVVQRPQPADAPRPGLGAADPHPRPGAPATGPASAPQKGAGPTHAAEREIERAAGDAPGAPLPRLPGPRGPRPLGPALVQARPRRRHAPAPGRAPHQHRGPAVRPGLRGAHRARLPDRRRDGAPTSRSPTRAAT